MTAGSLEAIIYEWQHGTWATFIDEILHAFDWLIGDYDWRFRFCQWAHKED